MPRLTKYKWSIEHRTCRPAFGWDVTELGSDEYGQWLGSRKGTPIWVAAADAEPGYQADDAVFLMNRTAWHVTTFWFSPSTDLTIDICAPPVHGPGGWAFVDLELDLYRAADGSAGIVDQDEFADLAATGLVNPDDLGRASATADRLLSEITERAEPFGDVGPTWLTVLRG